MDQDDTTAEAPFEEAEPEQSRRGPILTTLSIRVTIREDEAAPEGSYVPTNDEAAAWTEEAFRTRGYASVNATAEKV